MYLNAAYVSGYMGLGKPYAFFSREMRDAYHKGMAMRVAEQVAAKVAQCEPSDGIAILERLGLVHNKAHKDEATAIIRSNHPTLEGALASFLLRTSLIS